MKTYGDLTARQWAYVAMVAIGLVAFYVGVDEAGKHIRAYFHFRQF